MTRSRVLQLGNLVFWALVAVAGLRYVVPKWSELGISSRLSTLDLGWILGGAAILTLQYLAVFALWCTVLRLLGGRAGPAALFRAFGLSLLPKYVPGKLLGPGLRTRLTAAAGIPYPVAIGSLAWEMALALLSASSVILLGILVGASRDLEPAGRWILMAFLTAAGVGLIALRTPRLRSLADAWLHIGTALRHRAAVLAVFSGYSGSWLLYSAAHWMVASAVAPIPPNQFFPLLIALAASWSLGVVSVFAPAGLGVREGLLFVFARGLMGAPAGLLFVTLSRLVIFGVEMLMTLAAAMMPAEHPSAGFRVADAPPP
jgi:glycosyltransferase 2 family protein